MVAPSRPATGDGMKWTVIKQDSARVAWLGLIFVGTRAVMAQAPDEARNVDSVDTAIVAAPELNSGELLKMPVPSADDQKHGSTAANNTQTAGDGLQGDFIQRLTRFYWADWTGKLPSSPAPARRALDAPLDSSPFPSSDWGYGGSSPIGVPDGNVYPLMTALKKENSRTKIYGWVAGSVNASTSSNNNFPVSYDIFPNRVELNQAVVYVERLPNTVQKDHFDWGYHLTAFYGIDYRFTTAKDYLSQQLLKFNRQYGFDPVLEYVDLYFPVKDGLNIRIGRFLSVPGIEAQLAPNNYNMTHSLLYTIDPFTDTGVYATLKLNKQWIVQCGVSAGHDVALWSDDAKASGIFCLNYSAASKKGNFYGCANGSK